MLVANNRSVLLHCCVFDCFKFWLVTMSHFVGAKAMQAKQQSLLKRVDVLDQECEELHGQMVEWKDKHRDLQLQLQQMSEEKEQVQALLTEQQV